MFRKCNKMHGTGRIQESTTMENKAFELGIIVGRFQVLHKGHGYMIRKALQTCSEVAVFIGSSQESGTLKNPLSYELRADLLRTAIPDVKTYPLPDIGVGNNNKWGDYVLENAECQCGSLPDLIVSGFESRRAEWIDEKWKIAELSVPKIIDISATQMIKYMIDDERYKWEQYIEPGIADRYDEIRKYVLASRNNIETMSI